jgi:signal transduction histidine kinase
LSFAWQEYDDDGRAHALLEVEDRAIGIPADELPLVFELFHHGQNVDPEVPGNGLGLWVSRAILARHGGTLTLASREGQRTTARCGCRCGQPRTRPKLRPRC